nr:venom polypeptide precursor [Doratifera vulnerans]
MSKILVLFFVSAITLFQLSMVECKPQTTFKKGSDW